MTRQDDPAPPRAFINAADIRRLKELGEPFRVRYEPQPWTGQPTFVAIYTLKDGTERAYVKMLVSKSGVAPKALTLWPGVWRHHREYGDGEPLVLRIVDPLEEGAADGGPQPRARGRRLKREG